MEVTAPTADGLSRDVSQAASGSAPAFYVGTYARSGGSGAYPLYRRGDGGLEVGAPTKGVLNASFGAYSERFGLHYLVDESSIGSVAVCRSGPDGLACVSSVPSHGEEPCFITLDPAQTCLAVANYASGDCSVIALDPLTGYPTGRTAVRRGSGSGPVADRQGGPHAHCTCFSPDGGWLFQTDLGTDSVYAYAYDAGSGELGERLTAYEAPAASGPRHIAFGAGEGRAFLLSELASTITVLNWQENRFEAAPPVSTLPPGHSGENLGGHLALNSSGNRLYASNRGHDSIAVFAVAEGGGLSLLQHVPSGGSSPRQFHICEDDRCLLVIHEEDQTLCTFSVDPDGLLKLEPESLSIPGAAFIFPASAPSEKSM